MTIPSAFNEDNFTPYLDITEHNVQKKTDHDNAKINSDDHIVGSTTKLSDIDLIINNIEKKDSINTTTELPSILSEVPESTTSPTSNTSEQESYYSNYNYNLIHKNNWYKNSSKVKTTNYIKDLIKYKELRDKNIHTFCKNQHNCSKYMLKDFTTNIWPTETHIHCWWCCHPFNSIPCSIPEKIVDDTFIVYGIFCSPECSAAYLFNDHSYSTRVDIWTKYSLLNLLYKDIYKGKQIEQAYSRELLKIFGGPLSINTTNKSLYTLHMPSLKSIIPIIRQSSLHTSYSSNTHVINTNSIHNNDTYNYSSVDIGEEQQPNIKEDTLVLKRSKPFRKYTNTLEKCMNLKLNTK